MTSHSPLDDLVRSNLETRIVSLEEKIGADVITVYSPLTSGVDSRFMKALEANTDKRSNVAVILDTFGGIAEVVERMVTVVRHHYQDVLFIVPDKAMSAGTMFVMSGDRILMNYFSVLGPIDPQIVRDGKLVPALSYLNQYETLIEKSRKGTLTTAEYALISKFDLGELHTLQQARDLSIDLLEKWLSNYKFKDWEETEARKAKVTPEMRAERAREVARLLSDNERWHSHSRGIPISTLSGELKLRIEDYKKDPELDCAIHEYFDVFVDFMTQKGIASFIHSKWYY